MQQVSNGTDSATLVLMAKCRDVVYTGLLSMEVNVKTALRLHFISVVNMCIYVPYATPIPETEMATFRKKPYCLLLKPRLWCLLCDPYF